MNIGVTGGFLSGKSTFASLLTEKIQCEYFSCDEFIRELYKKEEIQKIIVDNFGEKLYIDGKFQKRILSDIVFNSKKQLQKLESLIIPFVEDEIKNKIKESYNNIVFEIPLLYEQNLDKIMDFCILIRCSKEFCLDRVKLRGFTQNDYIKRSRFFLDENKKIEKNPIIVNNEGSLEDLKQEVNRIVKFLQL